MAKNDVSTKVWIYGTNFITPSLTNIVKDLFNLQGSATKISNLKEISNAANPLGGLFFGGLDLVGFVSPKVKESKFTRLAKFGGVLIYGSQTAYNILSITKGDYGSFMDFAFNSSMAYQLGKDTYENYKSGENDLIDDVQFWK